MVNGKIKNIFILKNLKNLIECEDTGKIYDKSEY